MTFPLSKEEHKFLNEIENKFKGKQSAEFSFSEKTKYVEIIDELLSKKLIIDASSTDGICYIQNGDIAAFKEWVIIQDKKAKKLNRRGWRIAIISALIGAAIGLIPTVLQLLGVINNA